MTGAAEEQAPLFQVVSGAPTDEELAALAAVLTVLRREKGRPHTPGSSVLAGGWRSHWHLARHGLLQGHGAWRSAARR